MTSGQEYTCGDGTEAGHISPSQRVKKVSDNVSEERNGSLPLVNIEEGKEESNSLINPVSPSSVKGFALEEDKLEEILQRWKWSPRDTGSQDSLLGSSHSEYSSICNDSVSDESKDWGVSNLSVLDDMKALKLRSNRGRPKKKSGLKENKYFKVRSNKKLKKLRRVLEENSPASGEAIDEARAILDTGLQMGLILAKDRGSSLNLIKKNLMV